MNELNALLRPCWGSEKWIQEGWATLNPEEKELIHHRMQTLFQHGLPFELKHDKIFYIYTFSLLAQLEVLAIQIPLKFASQMASRSHRERMHVQLLDEIFHGLVFTKIVYMLCAPYALPPAYCEDIETLCNFIRQEECPKTAVVLLNLIGEGWIEEIFRCLKKHDIAPRVFSAILEDEHRHVSEADLYRDIGLPDPQAVSRKLEYLEGLLLTEVFLQYKYVLSICTLLGVQGTAEFILSLNKKHEQQLKKINLQPSMKWQFFTSLGLKLLPQIQEHNHLHREIELSPLRQLFMTQWSNPSDPTMVGQFGVDVSCLDIFNKKYPSETLTTLMLQTISQGLMLEDSFRNFLSHHKLYQSQEAYTALVVKLPNCGDHIGTIVFANCHKMPLQTLSMRIKQIVRLMVYCYKKREKLEKKHPYLKEVLAEFLYDFQNGVYPYPMPGNSVVSLSNIGFCGYQQAKSPLRANEALKFTLLEVERRPVWDKEARQFIAKDILPVSISADHRVFDGNLPIPKLISSTFQEMFKRMKTHEKSPLPFQGKDREMLAILDQLLSNDIEMGYKTLTLLQTLWPDFMKIEDLFKDAAKLEVAQKLNINSLLEF